MSNRDRDDDTVGCGCLVVFAIFIFVMLWWAIRDDPWMTCAQQPVMTDFCKELVKNHKPSLP